ncbi:MAG: ankyrin repeat domain-containing protein [Sphingobacterium sp.]|nr:ankyrin repeat domain-containing protein [Sphingobacterium sp.]
MKSDENDVFQAIAAGDLECVKRFLLAGADPNFKGSTGWTLLKCAIEHENKEIIQFLIHSGADVNYQSSGEWTPLHQAVDISIDGTIQTGGKPGEEPTDIIQYLLDHGADMNIKDMNGASPLDMAINYRSKKIITFLNEYEL